MKLVIDFQSRDCKGSMHKKCCGKWQGLGFHIICNCSCHSKKEEALAEVVGPEANAIRRDQSSKDVTLND